MKKILGDYATRLARLEKSTNPFSQGVAWLGHEKPLVPFDQATIPLRDQGFLHGDLTYDVPAVWDGRFFRLDDHIDRLSASCEKIRLRLPLAKEHVKAILLDMVSQSGIQDAFVEIIVTRGFKNVRDLKQGEAPNHLYMFVLPYVWVMDPEVQMNGGGSAVVTRTVRRTPPGSFDPTVKNLQWGDLTRAMHEARDRSAMYPFLTDGDTNLTEGSGFNVCIIRNGVLYTADKGVLEGVTRKSVFDVARREGIEVRCETVPVQLAYEADEILMCTTAGGIMPVTELDGKPVGDGEVGPLTKKIWDGYWAMHYEDEYTTEIKY